jgi:hypothetical protein
VVRLTEGGVPARGSYGAIVTARRHHYVPQCYLRGFVTNPKKPKLFVIDGKDRRSFHTAPMNVAAERDFHRIEVEGVPPDALETAFSGFETDLSDALQRIIASRSIKDQEDRAYLFNLMSLMAVKNPRHREGMRDFHEQIIKQMMSLMTATPERWASQVRRAKADGAVSSDSDVNYETMRKFVEEDQYKVSVKPGWHLAMELKSLDAVLPFFFNRNWALFRAPPGKTGFITSDHPICLMWADPKERTRNFPGPGFGMKRTQIVFPISNELAVIGAFEAREEEMDAPEWLIAQINGTVAIYSERQIYAKNANFMYRLAHNTRTMRGNELVADQARQRPGRQPERSPSAG